MSAGRAAMPSGTTRPESHVPTESPAVQTVSALAGTALHLHPALVASADPLLRTASADPATATLTVPARSVAVYVADDL